MLGAETVVAVEVPVTDQRDVLGAHQGRETVQVGERTGAAAGGEGEIQRGDLPVRLIAGMLEVGVPVQVDQAIAARRRRASSGPRIMLQSPPSTTGSRLARSAFSMTLANDRATSAMPAGLSTPVALSRRSS
jgi:hypothetical protein